MIKVVTFGGGGGQSQILSALKEIEGVESCAVCTSSDSGGSTGKISRSYRKINGYLGDVSKCLCALSDDSELAGAMMQKFHGGILKGHSLKNIVFSNFVIKFGERKALEMLHKLLKVSPGNIVMPCSWERSILKVELEGGRILEGESYINSIARNPLWRPENNQITKVWLSPNVKMNPEISKKILDADYAIICPGDLYTSVIPSLLPEGIGEKLRESKARLIGIMNLMTKLGETDGCGIGDLAEILERYLNGKKFDYLLLNDGPIDEKLLDKYKVKEFKVKVLTENKNEINPGVRIIKGDYWMKNNEGYIRHDSRKIREALKRIMVKK